MSDAVRASKLPKYVYDFGSPRRPRLYYWRGKGHPKKRIRAAVNTPEFHETLAVLIRGDAPAARTPAESNSLRWLCERYMGSESFRKLGDSTRRVRRQIIEGCFDVPIEPDSADLFRDMPIRFVTPKAIRVLRDRKAEKPEAANARIKALRQVFAWGIEIEEADLIANPAMGVRYFPGSPSGFHTWSVAEIGQFQERHAPGSKARLALALLMYTGVRRSDVVRLGPPMVSDGWLRFTEAKGAARVAKERVLPVLPELQQEIDTAHVVIGAKTFLVTEFGSPFTVAGFGNWFADRCREAGVPGRAHGLRKAGATIAAENGASDQQLMAIFGWTSPRQAGVYTRTANKKKLAGDAMHLLRPTGAGTESFPSNLRREIED